MEIKEVRTGGKYGRKEYDDGPSITFVMDWVAPREEVGVAGNWTWAKGIMERRHNKGYVDGFHFNMSGDYNDPVRYLTITMNRFSIGDETPADFAESRRQRARALGDEFAKVMSQVPAAVAQMAAWAEANGLKAEMSAWRGECDVVFREDEFRVRGCVRLAESADPLRFDFDEVETEKLLKGMRESIEYRKKVRADQLAQKARNHEYEAAQRSKAAEQAAATRKANKKWERVRVELARCKVKTP